MKNQVILSSAFLCLSIWLIPDANGASRLRTWIPASLPQGEVDAEDGDSNNGKTCYGAHSINMFEGYEQRFINLARNRKTYIITRGGAQKSVYKIKATEPGKGLRIDCKNFRFSMKPGNRVIFYGHGLDNIMKESELPVEYASKSNSLTVRIETTEDLILNLECMVSLTNDILPKPPKGCVCGKRNPGPPKGPSKNRQLPSPPLPPGQEAKKHEYPYLVDFTSLSNKKPICGGSIIFPSWVLTSASCVYERYENNTCAAIGDYDWTNLHETSKTFWKIIEKIITHPEYKPGSPLHDIALVKLKKPITFTMDNRVAPICLPIPELQNGNADPGTDVTLIGWGSNKQFGPLSQVVRKVNMKLITKANCEAFHGTLVNGDTMICAMGDTNKGPCKNDLGGPLMKTESERDELLGIASYTWICGAQDPIIFTRVGYYLDWIYSVTGGTVQC